MLDKHRAPVALRTPDFRNRDVCCHHTESNALPTELRDLSQESFRQLMQVTVLFVVLVLTLTAIVGLTYFLLWLVAAVSCFAVMLVLVISSMLHVYSSFNSGEKQISYDFEAAVFTGS